MLGVMAGDLRVAVEQISVALDELRAGPVGGAVLAAIDQAAAAVAALGPDMTVLCLRRTLLEIEACHRDGLTTSPRLEIALSAVRLALQIDPHWG
jgi:hypothetical protein